MKPTALLTAIVVSLVVLHHDFWLWNDATLIGGFVPVGLAWHGAFSLVAAGCWGAVVMLAWPEDPFSGDDEGAA